MKKIISFALCLTIILSIGAPTFAANETRSLTAAEYSIPTEFSSIKKSSTGEYAVMNGAQGEALPVGRLDIDVSNEDAVNDVLEMNNVSDEVKEYLVELSEKIQNDPANEEVVATLFSQDLLPQTAQSRSTGTGYYTYNGMEMKSDFVYVYDIATGYQFAVNGSSALSVANIVSSIAFYAGGILSKTVSLGGTLLNIFQAAAGGTVTASSANDFTQINLKYDGVKQWTYGKMNGEWYLGYCSEKITIDQITMYQFFVVNGVGTDKYSYRYPSTVVKSSSFDSPWSKAYNNLHNPVTEWVTYKINGVTWYFL